MKEVFLIRQSHLEDFLFEAGFEVISFNQEKKAFYALKERGQQNKTQPAAILCEYKKDGSYRQLLKYAKGIRVPAIVLSEENSHEAMKEAFDHGASDFFSYGIDMEALTFRINSLDQWKAKPVKKPIAMQYQIPVGKRVFDLAVSLFLIIMLLPLFIFVGLAIKLTSRGPIFYSSPRVGTGYKIFPFYKFRSMRVNADKLLKNMKHLNHYDVSESLQDDIQIESSGPMLVGDDAMISEEEYLQQVDKENKQAFVKFKNDPRITKIGHFIRMTSIDELPQLFNVLLGHMSIVGNRPLPLYEAEKLTSDDWTLRFLAPAGITGLWQVTERGKASTSEDSRKMLDVLYAKKYSMWMDLKILIKTPLAAFQQEKV